MCKLKNVLNNFRQTNLTVVNNIFNLLYVLYTREFKCIFVYTSGRFPIQQAIAIRIEFKLFRGYPTLILYSIAYHFQSSDIALKLYIQCSISQINTV